MGMDIDAESAVVIPLTKFLKCLTDEQVFQLPERLRIFLNERKGPAEPQSSTRKELFGTVEFKGTPTRKAVLQAVYRLAKDRVVLEEGKYGTAYINGEEELTALFNDLFQGTVIREGVIKANGEYLIKPKYRKLAVVSYDPLLLSASMDGQTFGLLDQDETWIIEPRFGEIHWPFETHARARDLNGKMGVIDRAGTWVIPPRFDQVGDRFSDGRWTAKSGNLWGVIDQSGEWVVEPRYDCPGAIVDDTVWLRDQDGNTYRLTDKVEKLSDIAPYEEIRWHGEWGAASKGGLVGIVDRNDSFQCPPRFERVGPLWPGSAAAQEGGLWGIIDLSGNWVVRPRFQRIEAIGSDLAAAQEGELWGIIHRSGDWLVKPRFSQIEPASGSVATAPEDIFVAQENELWGYLDRSGNWIVEPQFEDVSYFEGGLAAVNLNGRHGFIDKSFEFVIPPQYDDAGSFHDGLALVELDGHWGCIDINGQQVIIPQYTDDSCQCLIDYGYAIVYEELPGLLPNTPPIASIKAFGSSRLTGNDSFEVGKPYLVFEPERCFLKVLSDEGKELAKFLKKDDLDVEQWSTYSI